MFPKMPIAVGDTLLDMEVKQILQGGMCQIFVCTDSYNQAIAVKMLRPELVQRGKVSEDQFRREAEVWLLLGRHPNIVHAMEIASFNEKTAILMPYYERGSLENFIGPDLSRDDAITYAMHFCFGMIHAAQSIPNFVHRDIKPGNCLIGADNFLKISDFGLVRAFDDGSQKPSDSNMTVEKFLAWAKNPRKSTYQTQEGSAMGTRLYMPPEQFEDAAKVDVRSDIYSFGVLLYQMLSGRRPIEPKRARSIKDWQEAHLNMAVPPLDNNLSQTLRDLVYACLAKKPRDRPKSFTEILNRLRSLHSLPAPPSTVIRPDIPENVREFLREGTDLFRRTVSLVSVGRLQEALDYANHVIQIAEKVSADFDETLRKHSLGHAYASKGMVLRVMKRNKEAMIWVEKALQHNPDNTQALQERGFLYNETDEFDKAVAVLERCYEIDSTRPDLAHRYGFALNATGNFEKAQSVLMKELETNPDDYNINRELGYSTMMQRQWNKSIAYYEKALALGITISTHERGEIMCNIGLLHFYRAREDGNVDAIDDINKWLNAGINAIHGAPFEQKTLNYLRQLGLLNSKK